MMLGKDRALWDRDAVYIPDPVLQNRPGVGGVGQYTITERTLPFSLGVPHNLLGSPCLPPEERRLSMPEIGEKERNY